MSLSGLGRALQLNRLLLIGASYPPAMNALFTTTAILDGYEKSPMHSLPSPVSMLATSTSDNRIASIKFMSLCLTLRRLS